MKTGKWFAYGFTVCLAFIQHTLLFHGTECFSQSIHCLYYYTSDSVSGPKLHLPPTTTDSLSLRGQIADAIALIREKGYLEAGTDSLRFVGDTAYIGIHIGQKYQWLSLDFSQVDRSAMRYAGISGRLSEGKTVNAGQIKQRLRRLAIWYADRGYPFASVGFTDIHISDASLSAKVQIEREALFHIDSIVLKESGLVRKNYLYRYTGIMPGDIYCERHINELGARLAEIEFLQVVRPPAVEYTPGKVDLYYYMKQRRASTFSGIAGFERSSTDEKTLSLTGDINLSLVNMFRAGEKIDFMWKSTSARSQELNLGARFPYIFSSSVGVEGFMLLEKIDTSILNTAFEGNLFFSTGGENNVGLFLKSRTSALIGQNPDTSLRQASSLRLSGLNWYFEALDYRLNPRRGVELNGKVAYGRRSVSTQKNSIASLSGKGAVFLPMSTNAVLYLGLQARYQTGNRFFVNELERIGGLHSFRGIDEKSLPVSACQILTIEIRYLFGEESRLFVFSDQGWWEKRANTGYDHDRPLSFGLGMRLATGNSLFDMAFAVARQKQQPFDLNQTRLHVGYTARF